MTYPHAWRYRDFVIDSFNADKPFDHFVKQQLAGDLMPVNDDQLDTTTRVFLGTSVVFARCHDHKFDPIPHRDYYAMVGISGRPLHGLGLVGQVIGPRNRDVTGLSH